MHEYAVMQSLVEAVLETLRKRPPCFVKEVRVTVGEDSGYVVESLKAAYEVLVEGTVLLGSNLLLLPEPGTAVTLQRLVLEEEV